MKIYIVCNLHACKFVINAKKDYLFASKLVALTSRNEIAMRNVYDVYYFSKCNWDINPEVIRNRTGKNTKEYLVDCISFVEKMENAHILKGLGELLGE